MKRVRAVVVIITICLVFSAVNMGVSVAAESAKAVTFRLEKAEGTVEVFSGKGKSVAPSEGMLFYSGDTIQTSSKSYAYISLDDNKLLKLDELSQASIKKTGKKLEITLDEGALYFEVNEKLANDETMTVGTATISLSIRGTAGVVRKRNIQGNTQDTVWLLEGEVELSGIGQAAGRPVITVWGGERVDYVEESGQWMRDLINIMEIPGFADIKMRENTVLMDKISSDSGLDTEWIILNADTRVIQDQQVNQQAYGNVFYERQMPTAAPEPDINQEASPVVIAGASTGSSDNGADDVPANPPEDNAGSEQGGGSDSDSEENTDSDSDSNQENDAEATDEPTIAPTVAPTETPTAIPSATPTATPSVTPDSTPSATPTSTPDVNQEFIVIFYDYTGEPIYKQYVMYGQAANPPEAPAREGFQFIKWTLDYSYVTSDLSIFPMYGEVTPEEMPTPTQTPDSESTVYIVTFYDWGLENVLSSQKVSEGDAAVPPEAPVRDGYEFIGWSTEEYNNVICDLDIVAQYKAVQEEETPTATPDNEFTVGE